MPHTKPQEPLYTEIYRSNAATQREVPDQAPAFPHFPPTVRTPKSMETLLGEEVFNVSYLVGGLEHFLFFHILGITIPID